MAKFHWDDYIEERNDLIHAWQTCLQRHAVDR